MSDVWKTVQPFATGSLAGMVATCCIQPIDMVKVRIQLLAGTAEAAGPITIASNMMKNEGLSAFYTGLSAGLTRQVVYTGARLGLFDKFTAAVKEPGKPLSFGMNAVCASALEVLPPLWEIPRIFRSSACRLTACCPLLSVLATVTSFLQWA
jgi:solute carrier family 25 oxoglutarate transporter 11